MTARLYTIPEAADILNVRPTWLRDKVTARKVPFTKLGRHVRFTDEHLAQIIADGEEPTVNRIAYARGRRRSTA